MSSTTIPCQYNSPGDNPMLTKSQYKQIKRNLRNACERLNREFRTNLTFTINDAHTEIKIYESLVNVKGKTETNETVYSYGYGAVAQLELLYSQYINLIQLTELFKQLSEFGYRYARYSPPKIGTTATVYIVRMDTMEELHVFASDEEVKRYTKILQRARAARQLLDALPKIKPAKPVEVRFSPDGFTLIDPNGGVAIPLDGVDAAPTQYAKYDYTDHAVTVALNYLNYCADK